MSSKYKAVFLLPGNTELKSKEFVRPEAIVWYAKAVPAGAKKIKIENLLLKSSKVFSIDEFSQRPKYIEQIKDFLGVADE